MAKQEIKPLPSQPIGDSGRILVPVICPTREYQGAPAQSIATIWNALWCLNREPAYVQAGAHGYAFVRNSTMQQLKKTWNKEVLRCLLIDDDIMITQQEALMEAILMADRWGWNFVSPYRVKDGKVTICHANGVMMTQDEYLKITSWDIVENAGLGFYYGDVPLDYVFHEGGKHAGEDLNFFADNPWIKPRFVDLGLIHLKVMPLGLHEKMDVHDIPGTVREAA